MRMLLMCVLFAGMAMLDRDAHAAIDACVSTREELSQQFLIAQASSQDITLKVVRGSYDIAGTHLVSSSMQRVGAVSLLGGYAPGCATRIVDPANTILSSSGSGEIFWRTFGSRINIEGITFSGNGTALTLANAPENDDSVALTLRRNVFRDYAPAGAERARVSLYTYLSNSGSRVSVENNLMHGNFAGRILEVQGWAPEFLAFAPLDIRVVHNTIVANLAETGICVQSASIPLLANNIVRDHAYDIDTRCYNDVSGAAPARSLHNSFETRRAALPFFETATSTADPLFVDASANFRLQNASPALNTGSTSSTIGLPATDIEGNLRFQGIAPDRGAYENANNGQFVQTVSNINSSGPGSLRQAILSANGTPGLNLIFFDIPGACPRTINLASALPAITESVRIDFMTQPGAQANTSDDADNATRCVILRPATVNAVARGLATSTSTASGVQLGINGLAAGGFSEAAVYIAGGNAHYVQGSQFGGSVGGATLPANATNVLVGATSGVRVGGPDELQRNVIGGATVAGVSFELASSSSIENNLIGVAANGRFAEPNAIGVRLSAANDNLITDNVISGNGNGLVVLEPGGFNSRRNLIGGNRIGLRALPVIGGGGTSDYRLGNTFNGLLVYGDDNVVGACRYVAGGQVVFGPGANTIAWNGTTTASAGINVRSGRGVCLAGNRVYGNNGLSGQQIDIGNPGIDLIDNDSAPATDALSNRGINAPVTLSAGGSDARGSLRVGLQSRNGIYRVLAYSRAGGCLGSTQGEAEVEHTDAYFNVSISNATTGNDGFVEFHVPVSTVGAQTTLVGRGFVAQVQRIPNPVSEPADSSELGNCQVYRFNDVIFANGFEP